VKKKRLKRLNKIFVNALNNNVFQCASMAFSIREDGCYKRHTECYGYSCDEPLKKKLTEDYFFDLASLTKPLATVPVLLSLFEKNKLNPETNLADILSDCPSDKQKITLKEIMSHCAGFEAHSEYFRELLSIPEIKRKEFLLQKILEEPIDPLKREKHCYSDIGFMLLGLIIEKITGKEIEELTRQSLYKPLGIENDLFFPGSRETKGKAYVCTEKCLWSNEMLCGRVHDDNSRALGGQTGHAGLFGNSRGVMTLCELFLDQWQGRGPHLAYSNTLLRETLQRVGRSTWTMGFDMVSEKGSSAGHYFSPKSVGHLGYTGTSFWIDPEKDCIAVLLTNRVYYGRDNVKIKKFRPLFHDVLLEELS